MPDGPVMAPGAKCFTPDVVGDSQGQTSSKSSKVARLGKSTDVHEAAKAAEAVGELDGVVYAAGVAPVVPVRYLKDADIEACLNLNTTMPLLLIRELLKKKRLKISWVKNITFNIIFIIAIFSCKKNENIENAE